MALLPVVATDVQPRVSPLWAKGGPKLFQQQPSAAQFVEAAGAECTQNKCSPLPALQLAKAAQLCLEPQGHERSPVSPVPLRVPDPVVVPQLCPTLPARLRATVPLQCCSPIDPLFANEQLPLQALIKMDRGLFKCPSFPDAESRMHFA